MPAQHIDRATIAGLGLLLMPLLTMWHEIGGHAAACAVQGGRVADLGAFYVNCRGLGTGGDIVVALAGVAVNVALSLIAWRLWSRAQVDVWRLFWWLVWISEGFVAAGYFCFSGITGFGDLGTGAGGSPASSRSVSRCRQAQRRSHSRSRVAGPSSLAARRHRSPSR